jgi:hypothetical protein
MSKQLTYIAGEKGAVIKVQVVGGKGSYPTVSKVEYTSSTTSDIGLRPTRVVEPVLSSALGSSLITKQTGAGGRVCNAVRVPYDMCARNN